MVRPSELNERVLVRLCRRVVRFLLFFPRVDNMVLQGNFFVPHLRLQDVDFVGRMLADAHDLVPQAVLAELGLRDLRVVRL